MPDNNKILHLLAADGNWEPFVRVVGLAAALREHGFTSIVPAPEHSRLWELAEGSGVEVLDYTLERTLNPLRWRELGNMIKESGAGLVHVHDPDAATQLSRSRLFSSGVRIVTTRYDLNTQPSSAEYGGDVGAVVCPSQKMAEAFQRKAADDKIHVVLDGVNLAMADRSGEERDGIRTGYRDSYCPGKEKPLFIVSIAPLEEASALSQVLEVLPYVLAVLPQYHLFIVGEGSLRADLDRQVKITALENDVTFLEPDKAFHRLLAAADLYVSATKDDVSGLMVQAAMASGRAAVLRDSGCYQELAENGKTAVFAADGDTVALKHAMLELLESRTRREHIGRMAKAVATKTFNIATLAGTIADIYKKLL